MLCRGVDIGESLRHRRTPVQNSAVRPSLQCLKPSASYRPVRHICCAYISRPISLFGLARKEKRFLDFKEKSALNAGDMSAVFQSRPRITDIFDSPGAIVEWTVASVSARSRFAWRCLGLWTGLGIATQSPRGALRRGFSKRGNRRSGAPSLVGLGGFQRGKRNPPLAAFFGV